MVQDFGTGSAAARPLFVKERGVEGTAATPPPQTAGTRPYWGGLGMLGPPVKIKKPLKNCFLFLKTLWF